MFGFYPVRWTGTHLGIDFWTKGAFNYSEDTPDDLDLGFPSCRKAILVTHDHKDHCFVPEGIRVVYGVKSRKCDDCPDVATVGRFRIGFYATRNYTTAARHPKLNAACFLEGNGIKIVHLGDAHGTMADAALLNDLKEKIGKLDLLLLPIGSPTMKPVDPSILKTALEIQSPRLSIPMHNWSLAWKAESLSQLEKLGVSTLPFPGNQI